MVVKMPKIDDRTKKITWAMSAIIAIAIMTFAILTFWWGSWQLSLDDAFFFTIIAAVFPPAVLTYLDYRWRKAVDEHLPDLFRSIVQAEETGMTLPQALVEASKRDYGPLTAELRKMTTQMSWGMSFEEALLGFSKRVNTVLVRRTIPMIIEASRSGGHVEKVFDPMGKFIQTTLLLDKERRTQTRPYIAIVYVAFFVFMFTIVLLFKSFFVSTEQLPIIAAAVMSPDSIKQLFFHMTIVQSLFGGLVAGKMGEGTINAGLKHSLILMICGYIAIKLFL
jgi:flagellar protein FlaJ